MANGGGQPQIPHVIEKICKPSAVRPSRTPPSAPRFLRLIEEYIILLDPPPPPPPASDPDPHGVTAYRALSHGP